MKTFLLIYACILLVTFIWSYIEAKNAPTVAPDDENF